MAATGQMFATSTDNALYDLEYEYDQYGNLKRTDESGLAVETYSYDHLLRLKTAQVGTSTVSYAYDALGNLTQKSDFESSYLYQKSIPVSCTGAVNAGPHAVTAAGTRRFSYDANGNQICSTEPSNRTASYDAFNLPVSLSRGANTATFRYGSDNQRYYQSGGGRTTVYLDKLYERINTTEHKFYLGDYATVTFSSSPSTTRYLHKDRLNSIIAITDSGGLEVGGPGRLFDAFGKPRNGDMSSSSGLLNGTTETTRGFTQHEHLNSVQVIHMNGRAYDYNLGRFLSVDPFIQFPENSQSLNPYSYLMNNPMAGTDPSGYAQCTSTDGTSGECGYRPPTDPHSDWAHGVTTVHWNSETGKGTSNGSDKSPKAIASAAKPAVINGPQESGKEGDSLVKLHGYGDWPPITTVQELLRPNTAGTEKEIPRVSPVVSALIGVGVFTFAGLNAWEESNKPGDDSIDAGEFSPVGILKFGVAAGSLILRNGGSLTATAVRAGVKMRNAHLAGKTHPDTGIPFTKDGFPNFSSVMRAEVRITPTGSRPRDIRAANEAAGFSETPRGFTWHHHEDGTTLQLVPRDIHVKTGHTGGFSLGSSSD